MKKIYALSIIENLIKDDAIELIEDEYVELTVAQEMALDKELKNKKNNPGYLLEWKDVIHKIKRN